MPVREQKIEKFFIEELTKRGLTRYKLVSSVSGLPDDIILGRGGRAFFAEIKTEDGVLSARQTMLIEAIRDLGFLVYIIRSRWDALRVACEIEKICSTPRKSTKPKR